MVVTWRDQLENALCVAEARGHHASPLPVRFVQIAGVSAVILVIVLAAGSASRSRLPSSWAADTAPNYALVNGRLQFAGIPLAKGSLNPAVFGRNLFDKKYRNFGIDFSPAVGWSIDTYGPPRTFGLELAYNFSQE